MSNPHNNVIGLLRKGCATAGWLLLSAAVVDCGGASEAYVPERPAQPIPLDEATYAFIGREALERHGYEKIIELGVAAGFLRYPEQPNAQNFVGQALAEAAHQAWPVFTEGAVMAFLTSQVDSPAPGPADAIAIGMLVVALVSAGYVGVKVWTSWSATATTTPVPTVTAVPTATATTTTTSPPIAVPRKYPNQTCENDEMARLEDKMHKICDKGFAATCGGGKIKAEELPFIPCSAILLSIQQRQACIAARWEVQNKCFGGKPDDKHKKPIDDHQRGLDHCEALKLKNCAKGHPMANL